MFEELFNWASQNATKKLRQHHYGKLVLIFEKLSAQLRGIDIHNNRASLTSHLNQLLLQQDDKSLGCLFRALLRFARNTPGNGYQAHLPDLVIFFEVLFNCSPVEQQRRLLGHCLYSDEHQFTLLNRVILYAADKNELTEASRNFFKQTACFLLDRASYVLRSFATFDEQNAFVESVLVENGNNFGPSDHAHKYNLSIVMEKINEFRSLPDRLRTQAATQRVMSQSMRASPSLVPVVTRLVYVVPAPFAYVPMTPPPSALAPMRPSTMAYAPMYRRPISAMSLSYPCPPQVPPQLPRAPSAPVAAPPQRASSALNAAAQAFTPASLLECYDEPVAMPAQEPVAMASSAVQGGLFGSTVKVPTPERPSRSGTPLASDMSAAALDGSPLRDRYRVMGPLGLGSPERSPRAEASLRPFIPRH